MADDETAKKLATDVACAVFSRELNLRKAFSRLDVDKNGAIDRDEFAALLAPLSTACTAAATSAVFDLFDADKSGTISSSEFQDALLEYGGAAPPPPTKKPAAAAKHVEAIKEAAEYVEVDGDTMTDADVMDELSDRLEQEGVPLHTLYRVLAPRDGRMTRDTLRSVLEKMGLGYALASPAEEAAAAKKAPAVRAAEAVVAPAAQEEHVGDALEHANAFNVNQQRACEVLKSGDASDEAVRSLLPILKAKMHAHGYDTGKVGDLFLRLDADRSGSISPREFLELMRSWGVNLTAEQGVHLLEPFDVNLDGSLDFHEFVKWVEMWCPPEDENEYAASWRRGGPTDQRVWARSGDGAGRVGRVDRLMAMIDADHDGAIECYEFIRALSRKDDYDRPIGGGGGGGGLGQGRLNPDGSAKADDVVEAPAAVEEATDAAPEVDDDAVAAAWLAAVVGALQAGGVEASRAFTKALDERRTGAAAVVRKYGTALDGVPVLPAWRLLDLCAVEEDLAAYEQKVVEPRPAEAAEEAGAAKLGAGRRDLRRGEAAAAAPRRRRRTRTPPRSRRWTPR
ncbi:hypothetical protein JL722_12168 [Aureococcus anophagefferens]|nr:hypothetical protein JL722_12168 [Aureococcus anophagefferens]